MTTAIAQHALDIDHPAENEVVRPTRYTFRLSAPREVDCAEVSIDRGPWLPCRTACGFWWYDWTQAHPGPHTLSARAVDRSGEPLNSLVRRFAVARDPILQPAPPPPLRCRSRRTQPEPAAEPG